MIDDLLTQLGPERVAKIARPRTTMALSADPFVAEMVRRSEASGDAMIIEISVRNLADAIFGWIRSEPRRGPKERQSRWRRALRELLRT